MKHKKLLTAASTTLLLLLITTAVALWMVDRPVGNTMRVVVTTGNMAVLREDNLQPITSISWGDYVTGDLAGALSKNSSDAAILNTRILIKNTGSFDIVPAWNYTNLPSGFTLTCHDGSPTGAVFNPNDFNYCRLLPGNINGQLVFTLTLTNTSKAAGDYGFTIDFWAQQAPP